MPTETTRSITEPKYEIIPSQYLILENQENGYKTKVYRTRALRDFEPLHGEPVKKSDAGCFVEGVLNLSREYDGAWAEPTVILIGKARVRDNAYVGGHVYANDGVLDGNVTFRASYVGTPALLVLAESTEVAPQSLPSLRFVSLNPPDLKPIRVSEMPEIPLHRMHGYNPGTPSGPAG